VSGDYKCRSSTLGGANSAPQITLDGFERPLRGQKRKGKGKIEEEKGKEGTRENTSRHKFLVTALVTSHVTVFRVAVGRCSDTNAKSFTLLHTHTSVATSTSSSGALPAARSRPTNKPWNVSG